MADGFTGGLLGDLPQEDRDRLMASTFGQMGALLLAAGQKQMPAQRAQYLAQLGNVGQNIESGVFRAQQARLMGAQMQEKMREMEEIKTIDERRKSDPSGLAQAMGISQDLIGTMDARTLRDIAKQVTIKRATTSPLERAVQTRVGQIMGIPITGAPSAAPASPGQAPQPQAAPAEGEPAAQGVAPQQAAQPGVEPKMTATMAREIASDPIILAGNPELAKKYAEIAEKLETPGVREAQVLKARSEATRLEAMPKLEMALANKYTQNQQAIELANSVLSRIKGSTSGLIGAASQNIPGTPAFDLARDIRTLQSRLGLDELKALKDAGGTLGQVSNFELQTLQDSVASLDIGQTTEQLRKNVQKIATTLERSSNLAANAFKKDFGREPDIQSYIRPREEGQPAAAPQPAARQGAGGITSPEDVRSAVQSGRMTREQGLQILRSQFGFE